MFAWIPAAAEVVWYGIQIAAKEVEMLGYNIFRGAAQALAEAQAEVKTLKADMERELLKLNDLAAKSGISVG